MNVTIRLFAILRDRAGADHVEVQLPDCATVADALAAVAALPGLEAVGRGGVRMAVNREYAPDGQTLAAGDELALIPPVSGGAPEEPEATGSGQVSRTGETIHARVTADALALDPLLAFVASPRAGGVVTFQGLPRDIPALDYEAYPEMALERMWSILTECADRHGLCAIAAEHRVGSVLALEASIIVAASAPHREAAFVGAREALDRIKAEAPIWKIEVDEDGARQRVEGTLPQ
ncbi:MAG TPA: molybdenum cofactor biosynthesis protein MoaE [Solirubrobacteraceae bacterium]|nr:molybdenum cofactor biosynthesis protein MoaE [Solirubrobacteraceae bacterium]